MELSMNTKLKIVDLVPAPERQRWAKAGIYPCKPVFDLFCDKALTRPGKTAVHTPQDKITYGDLLEAVLRLTSGLSRAGVGLGDVVAYELRNDWRCCAIDLAVAALGAIVAPFPPGRGRLDMQSLLRRCQAKAVIVPQTHAHTDRCELIESLRPQLACLELLIVHGDHRTGWVTLDSLLNESPISPCKLPKVCPDSPVRLLVSSGTESEPKLVAYSHNALIGGRGRFLEKIASSERDFRALYLVPLGSSFGSTATFGVLCWLSGTLILLPEFEVDQAIHAIECLRPNFILGVPTMLQRMAADPALSIIDKSSLAGLIVGGAVIDPGTVVKCSDAFGCAFISLYGSADGVNCHTQTDDPVEVAMSSVGRPSDDVCEIRIINDNGQELCQGSVGEITARGPLSPMQYVNAPELDQTYRDTQGWVKTGDLGYIDPQGRLVLKGRKKDIIIRGGANISPAQIEGLIMGHPDVIHVACVAVPDSDLGQRVGVCITLKQEAKKFSLKSLSDYLLSQGLEHNRLPEYLRFYRTLPMTPAGKIDKSALTQDMRCLVEIRSTNVKNDQHHA